MRRNLMRRWRVSLLLLATFAALATPASVMAQQSPVTQIDYPGACATRALGINDNGQVIGLYQVPGGCGPVVTVHGFVRTGSSFATFDIPSSTSFESRGINNGG